MSHELDRIVGNKGDGVLARCVCGAWVIAATRADAVRLHERHAALAHIEDLRHTLQGDQT